jgi:hypothetical protein
MPNMTIGKLNSCPIVSQQLWGKVTTSPFGLYIQEQGVARYPSQLYEAFLEGLVLFVVLWIFSNKPRAPMTISVFKGSANNGQGFLPSTHIRQPYTFV